MYLKTMFNSSEKKVAQIKFTEKELKKMAVDEVLKNDDARVALEGKRIKVEVDWHVFKWDDPEHIATFTLFEED